VSTIRFTALGAVGGNELIRTGAKESLAGTGAMSDAAGVDSRSDTNPLQTLDLAGVDDIVRIQHTDVESLLRRRRKHFRSTHA
jgi:hypothetical protein